jgi:hypothetical protein
MIWLLLLLLLLCVPAVLLATVGMLMGVATLVVGFAVIWAVLFALLSVAGVGKGIASFAAFVLAFPVGWVALKWVPEPEPDKWRFPLRR